MTFYLSNRDGDGMTNEEGHYRFPSALFNGSVVSSGSVQVTQNSPLGMSVLIAAGDFKIDTSSGYAYMGWNGSSATVTISTSDPANPRKDAIVLYVDKGAATSASPPNNPGIIKSMAVAGTPAGVPTAPNSSAIQSAVGSGNPWIKIAEVTVAAAVTQITDANITDTRTFISIPALFIAADTISTSMIQNSAITTAKIADANITTVKIADANITAAKRTETSNSGILNTTTAGSQTITVGFKPTSIDFYHILNSATSNPTYYSGHWTPTSQQSLGFYASARYFDANAAIIFSTNGTSADARAIVTGTTATGFTINVTTASNRNFFWVARA